MCVCMNFSVQIPSSVCLLLALSYIAESVRGLTTLISTFLFDLCMHEHHKTVVQTHQELKYASPLLFSTIHTSEDKFC